MQGVGLVQRIVGVQAKQMSEDDPDSQRFLQHFFTNMKCSFTDITNYVMIIFLLQTQGEKKRFLRIHACYGATGAQVVQ